MKKVMYVKRNLKDSNKSYICFEDSSKTLKVKRYVKDGCSYIELEGSSCYSVMEVDGVVCLIDIKAFYTPGLLATITTGGFIKTSIGTYSVHGVKRHIEILLNYKSKVEGIEPALAVCYSADKVPEFEIKNILLILIASKYGQ